MPSAEHEEIRRSVRDFVDREVAPIANDLDRNNQEIPEHILRKMAELGYFGVTFPVESGGLGLDYVSMAIVTEELSRGWLSVGSVMTRNLITGGLLVAHGTPHQKKELLPRIARGELMTAAAFTEPDTGSDAANQKTRAQKTDSGWVINGAKMWISMANYAKVALIFAQTNPELGYKGLACFLVDTDQPGYTAQTIEHKMGLHASDTGSISLEDVEVSDDDMLGEVGDGFKIAMSNLDSGRYSVAAGCVGICRGCVEESVAYAKEREQFGRPIASFQLVQAMIADMVLKTDASRMLVWRAGWLKDQGRPNTLETSVAKLHATEASLECANLAIQVHGGAGYVDDHPVERYFRDARVTTLYEGTSQIQKLIIGRAMTGVNALVPS